MKKENLNVQEIQASIAKFSASVLQSKVWDWDIHIDEIPGCANIKRGEWLDISLHVLKLMTEQYKNNSNQLYLHIPLKCYANKLNIPEYITFEWLRKRVNLYSPPSFMLHPDNIADKTLVSAGFNMIKTDESLPCNLQLFSTFHHYPEHREYYYYILVYYKEPVLKIISKTNKNTID